MSIKTVIEIVGLLSALCVTSVAYAAGGGSGKEAELLGTEKDATPITERVNKDLLKDLPFSDMEDFKNAQKGFIARGEEEIKDANGKIVWSTKKFAFMQDLKKKAPATVNPSLWRQMLLVNLTGLFKVDEHIYQVRNYDLSNITFIEGKSGLIVMDPLVSAEPARAALDLYFEHRPKKPVVAVIYSHSHIDHFGGVRGIVDEADLKAGKVKIIAPLGFVENSIEENVMAGNAMSRRASYMYGNVLPKDEKGNVGAGLGSTTSSGNVTMIVPTVIIAEAWEDHVIDGLHFEFQLTLNTEAPSEMHYYIKEFKALCPAENVNHTMHNIYTLRGAKVRDSKAWAKHIDNMLLKWGDEAQVLFAPHHWPSWGNENINEHVSKQRDTYKFMHDQVLRLANHGYTIDEVGDMVRLPEELDQTWASHGYYGSISHNARAIFNFYLGYFDGNPSHLHKLPPEPAAKKYVKYMGGSEHVIEMAKEDFAKGEYRWVAEALDHLVFAQPDNEEAKNLLADTLEQLGFVAESGPWRNFYLSGARELREGVKPAPTPNTASPDIVQNMPIAMLLDYMAVRLNPEKAAGKKLKINFNFTDVNELYSVFLENSTLNNREGNADDADTTITTTRATLDNIMLGKLTVEKGIESGVIKVEGTKGKFKELQGMLDDFEFWFNIVTP
jgi:alkyl sulfatase BDS1-like metallo-beta-lactamase superfamily hydrolase